MLPSAGLDAAQGGVQSRRAVLTSLGPNRRQAEPCCDGNTASRAGRPDLDVRSLPNRPEPSACGPPAVRRCTHERADGLPADRGPPGARCARLGIVELGHVGFGDDCREEVSLRLCERRAYYALMAPASLSRSTMNASPLTGMPTVPTENERHRLTLHHQKHSRSAYEPAVVGMPNSSSVATLSLTVMGMP